MMPFAVAVICLIWYAAVALVCTIGYVQLWRYYSSPPEPAAPTDPLAQPDVTIIRPVKGLEPSMYQCLASTFEQVYPRHKIHVRLCVSDRRDPSFPVLEALIRDFPDFDARILVEQEDHLLQSGQLKLGPNPKISNMSRAYREAATDIVWIVDCNVWVGFHTLGRMVARLECDRSGRKNKFVHQLPLVVDISEDKASFWEIGGGRLEELFMSTAHAKFYTAINTVAIAPCIVGKSTMFRRSHLNSLTSGAGIDHFSQNICEDHLIGDLLWRQAVPDEQAANRAAATGRGRQQQQQEFGKHALLFSDLAIQPMRGMSVGEYCSRRVRWLRVRKFTVTLATLVEPGTESFLASAYGAYAFAALLPSRLVTRSHLSAWPVFAAFWLLSVSLWCAMDWTLYRRLQSGRSVPVDPGMRTPEFARPSPGRKQGRRSFGQWLLAWLGREALALPIWTWAFWAGTRVEWRGRRFWVGMDMKVHEIEQEGGKQGGGVVRMNGLVNRMDTKSRTD